MDRSFDFILAGIALIVGIMLLTGHGDIQVIVSYFYLRSIHLKNQYRIRYM